MTYLKQMIITWLNIIKEKFPIIFLVMIGHTTYLVSMLLTLYVLALVCLVSILQHLLMLLLTIGCLPLLIMSWAHSNLKYSGEKMHQDSLQKWENQLLKVSEKSASVMDTLSHYIKRSLYFMDSDK